LASVAQVLRMTPSAAPKLSPVSNADALLVPFAGLPLLPPAEEDLQRQNVDSVLASAPDSPPQMLSPERVRPVNLVKPEPLRLVPLGDQQIY
jgi:hypothetical protein